MAMVITHGTIPGMIHGILLIGTVIIRPGRMDGIRHGIMVTIRHGIMVIIHQGTIRPGITVDGVITDHITVEVIIPEMQIITLMAGEHRNVMLPVEVLRATLLQKEEILSMHVIRVVALLRGMELRVEAVREMGLLPEFQPGLQVVLYGIMKLLQQEKVRGLLLAAVHPLHRKPLHVAGMALLIQRLQLVLRILNQVLRLRHERVRLRVQAQAQVLHLPVLVLLIAILLHVPVVQAVPAVVIRLHVQAVQVVVEEDRIAVEEVVLRVVPVVVVAEVLREEAVVLREGDKAA